MKRPYYGPKAEIKNKKDIDPEFLRRHFHYDHETGVFTRKSWVGARGRITKEVVYKVASGQKYVQIQIGDKNYLAHRLAFVYMLGAYPDLQVDHIDGDGSNNKWENLRLVTHKENAQHNVNGNRNNTTGLRGVYRCRKKWRACITVDLAQKHLGTFETKEAAHAAYIAAKREAHFQ